MNTPEEEIDTNAPQQQGALSALQASHAPALSPEGRAWGANYLKEHPEGVDTKGEAALLQDFAANADEARQALRQAREKLAAQRMDPSILGLRFAQAMMAPSRYGIPDQWSNAVGSIADWRQQNQEFQQKQGAQDLNLAQQLSGVDRQSLEARMKLQELQERTQAPMIDAAMKATAKPANNAESTIGKLVEDRLGVGALQTQEGKALFDKYAAQKDPAARAKATAGELDPETLDYLYQDWNNTHALPPGYSRNPAAVNNIMSYIAHRAASEGNTDASIMANSQLMKSRQKAENDFTPGGKYGQALVSTNRVVAHLGDYMELFNNLNNKDPQIINSIKNRIKTWAGSEAPTDVTAVAPILGDELTKSIVPGGGGVTERQEFAHNFSLANSPEQAAGIIDKYLKFLKDQVEGTQYAYEQTLGKKDFQSKYLTPRTRTTFGYAEPQADTPATDLPPAALKQLQEGYTTTFANGQKWTLHGGQPVQVK